MSAHDTANPSETPPVPAGGMTLSSLITFLLVVAVVLRLLIGQTLLNQYVGYTTGTGFVGGRFHPSTYLTGAVLTLYLIGLVLPRHRIVRRGRHLLVALALSFASVMIALYNGGQNAAAVVLDVIIAPLIMAYLLTQLDERRRELFFRVILYLVTLNLLPVLIERATGIALFPRDKVEQFFRPQGFLDHPLVAGVAVYCTMWTLLRIGRRSTVDVLWSLALLLQQMLLAVRLPLIVGTVLFMLQILKLGRRSGTGKIAAGTLLVLIPPALFAVAVSFGWLDRFLMLGLFDEKSAGSRLVAFDVLSALSSTELWGGVPNERIEVLLKQFGIGAIENSFVSYVLLGGLGVAFTVHFAIVVATAPTLRRDVLFFGITLAIFLGSIVFSIKTAGFMIYILLATIVAERRVTERQRALFAGTLAVGAEPV